MHLSSQLIEITSWRVVSEMFRCYPNSFRLAETHPGGGQYDCLSLYDMNNQEIMSFNRGGSLHYFMNAKTGRSIQGSDSDFWEKAACHDDIKRLVTEVLETVGLTWPTVRPVSTPLILTYRYIAEFLTHALFGKTRWKCINGYCDTSGYSPGRVKDLDAFPSAKDKLRSMPEKFGDLAYNSWIIKQDDDPLLCLTEDGFLFDRKNRIFSLQKLYLEDRRVWHMIIETAGSLLP